MMNLPVSPSRILSMAAVPMGAAVGVIAYSAGANDQLDALAATSAVTAVAAFAALGLALRR